MQNLALCYLWKELEGSKSPPDDLRAWFINAKENDSGKFFVYLVEPAGKIEKFYTLSADPDNSNIAVLESADIDSLDGNPAIRLPFNKPSGPRSPQIGPVIKRSYSAKKGSGPTLQILKSTLSNFEEISNSTNPWADYFLQVHTIFNRKQISYAGEVFNCGENALHQAVQIIPETKPVFLVVKDQDNNLPGDLFEYRQYLSTKLNADNKYCIKEAPPVKLEHCYCCGTPNVNCYSAGLSKSGLNIFNIDRDGAFPNVTNTNAFMSYAICENCADLLYVFKLKFHRF